MNMQLHRQPPVRKTHRTRNIAIGAGAVLLFLPAASFGFSHFFPATTIREIEINASPEQVWEVLTDFESYPVWNPHIITISGTPEVGEKLDVEITAGGSTMRFNPTVLTAEPGIELRWLGQVLVPGLFDGEHSFTLTETPAGGTRLVQSEKFTGILAPTAPLIMDLGASFEDANQALRDRAEEL
ncbi:SRPBCC family protein [Corynebacterium sp. A21]|uniref:SRPBCC family protein n=1 Tax=Corynebacterium sp. A21 TaxID=3457318 RepID=UPI003FCF32AC